ncbi:c-type cytochrome [Azohydromonas australica]|uniref:c-type cytochrome n=1 Tax=Azohydromonas australica TaxID=364039 RepID=UPI0004908EE2|nr:c-type cytochrome [Azohydromonas australica]
MSKQALCVLAGLVVASTAAFAADGKDDAMLQLASKSGCMTCHNIEPGAKGPEGMAPIGPAWKDVSAKYKGVKGAEEQLTRTVLQGSNPYESHWKGKVSGLAMPPNHVAIKDADAKQLVKWILALDAKK